MFLSINKKLSTTTGILNQNLTNRFRNEFVSMIALELFFFHNKQEFVKRAIGAI